VANEALVRIRRLRVVKADKLKRSAHAQHKGPKVGRNLRRWEDPQFFDAFSVGESTWNYDGAQTDRAEDSPYHEYTDGYNVQMTNPYEPNEVAPEAFQETESDGANQVWQTFYPAQKVGPGGHIMKLGQWTADSGGVYSQAYTNPHDQQISGALSAPFFDASVKNIDEYGRLKAPFPGNPMLLLAQGYKEQSVNTSVACKTAGCNASSMMIAYDPAKQQGANCRLSVLVKPTDFGHGGSLDFIMVNNVMISRGCKPDAFYSCNNESNILSHMFTCVEDVDIQHLVGADGGIVVTAQISTSVNQSNCSYNGNLLYAIPQVTCLVNDQLAQPGNVSRLSTRPRATPVTMGQQSLFRDLQEVTGFTTLRGMGKNNSRKGKNANKTR